MLFWWLMIGFLVLWAIAVAIEVIWFWGPDDEPDKSELPVSSVSTADPEPRSEVQATHQVAQAGG